MKRAARIGITGKLGSGKSTLMRILGESGFRTVNTDDLAKTLMASDPALRSAIERLAGSDVYFNGTLNRDLLAAKLFRDATLRANIEALVHPAVMQEIDAICQSADPATPVAIESALLLAADLSQHFDYIVLVDASDQTILDRIRSSRNLSEEDARSRLAAQDYEHANFDEVDITIENTGNSVDAQAEFEERARTLALMLKTLADRDLPEAPLHHL
jgi:dephospho-CoA kinase